MLFHSLVRILGVVVMMGVLIPMVIQLAERRWMAASFYLCVLAGGLVMAFWADDRLKSARTQRDLLLKDEGEAFQGQEMHASLRWFRWMLLTALLTGLTLCFFGWMLPALGQSGAGIGALVMNILSGAFVIALPGLLAVGWRGLSGRYLFHIGPVGLQLPYGTVLPWGNLQGVDLRKVVVKNRTQWSLMLAIDEAGLRLMPSRWSVLFWQWPVFRLHHARGLAEMPLGFFDANPHALKAAVAKIGIRHGAPLVKGWHHWQPIAEAREAQRAQEEAEEALRAFDISLQEQFHRMGNQPNPDLVRLDQLNERLSRDLDRLHSPIQARLERLSDEVQQQQRHARTFMLPLWIAFGLVMAWVVVQLFLALDR